MLEKFAAILLLFQSHSGTTLPKFEDFPAPDVFHGSPAAPILRTPWQRTFRTMIRTGARDGANFAGYFTIVEWGCGASCGQMALIDQKTGDVFEGPARVIGYPLIDYPDEANPPAPAFKLDSRLLVIHGCPEEKNCGSYYYEWTGSRFKLLRMIPAHERK